jgi:adenylate cyclase
MGIEIERKFLLKHEAWRSQVEKTTHMTQGYINHQDALRKGEQKASVRVRIAGEQAFLNLKSRELGHTRQEFDYAIPLVDAQHLLELCVGGLIDKNRHYIYQEGLVWEIDEFFGDNQGLFVAEIELPHADYPIQKPDWCGMEVTDQLRYYNLALAERPFSQWRQEEKEPC